MSPLWAALRHGFAEGLRAARENFLPALAIQVLMALLVAGYYLHWPISALLDLLAAERARGGPLFMFAASGFSGGLLSEVCLVYFAQSGRWRRGNVRNATFKFCLLGVTGTAGGYFYDLMGWLLGDRADVPTILAKTALDQFVYSPFLACPVMALASHWRRDGYRARAWGDLFSPDFVGGQVVPVTVTNGGFWFPTVLCLYALPLPLQYPLALLATAIWGLLLISVTARRHPELEVLQG
jgi:hypothetical protein